MADTKSLLYLCQGLATIKQVKGWTFEDLRQELNKHLPDDSQIPPGQAGTNQIERWLATKRKSKTVPSGDKVLAIQAVIELHDYLLRK